MVIGVALLFISIGVLIKYAKMHFLIAGYNTMSPQEKAKYNIKGIAKLFRNVFFGMAFLMLLGYFMGKWLNNSDIQILLFCISLVIGVPYLLIKANSAKYKKQRD